VHGGKYYPTERKMEYLAGFIQVSGQGAGLPVRITPLA